MKSASIVVVLAAGCLGLAVIGTLIRTGRDEPFNGRKLAERVPREIGRWQSEDVPLGETETVVAAVQRLNYDDYVYRVYRLEGREIFLYAMFWRQGQISVREMAGHTPDGCWVANGAVIAGRAESRPFVIESRVTQPAEIRRFRFSSTLNVAVAWWHLWGGDVVPTSFAAKNVLVMVRELWWWLVSARGGHGSQLLVRIHGAGSIEDLVNSPPSVAFLREISEVWVSDRKLPSETIPLPRSS